MIFCLIRAKSRPRAITFITLVIDVLAFTRYITICFYTIGIKDILIAIYFHFDTNVLVERNRR